MPFMDGEEVVAGMQAKAELVIRSRRKFARNFHGDGERLNRSGGATQRKGRLFCSMRTNRTSCPPVLAARRRLGQWISQLKKKPDRHRAPVAPVVVTYIPGESYQDRHKRRIECSQPFCDTAARWSENHGIDLLISRRSRYWRFTRGDQIAEWWPGMAKCLLNRDDLNGIHIHEFPQLLVILKSHFGVD